MLIMDLQLAKQMSEEVADLIDCHKIGGLKVNFDKIAEEVLAKNNIPLYQHGEYKIEIGKILSAHSAVARKREQLQHHPH